MREPPTVVSLEGDVDFANRQRVRARLLELVGAERPLLLVDRLLRVTRLSLAFEVLPDLATGLESF
ncbi:MAG: hypothetical protein L0323_06675 [Planctomycetes bacterium]|nr:hypothetical protein [Planctomycetota bacterium]